MAFFGFVLAFMFFCHVRKQMRRARRESMGERDRHEVDWLVDWRRHWAEWNHKWAEQAQRYGDHHAEWHRQWAKRMERHVERDRRRNERRAGRHCGPRASWAVGPEPPRSEEEQLLQRARSRAAAEMGFYVHLTSYLGVIALLALINLITTWYPWFLWPAIGWGVGLFSHYMGVFGSRALMARYFDPAVRARAAAREGGHADREAGEPRRALGVDRARDPQSRSPRRRAWCSRWARTRTRSRTSSTRRWRSTSSIASSAGSRTCSSSPRRRTTRWRR